MKKVILAVVGFALLVLVIPVGCGGPEAGSIVIGAPLSTAYLYGWDAERAMTLAVEEINAAGGVNVGGEKRPFKLVVMDTRDLEPGVPTSESLAVVEKLILDEGALFIVGGPERSEAALACQGLMNQYKTIMMASSGVLTPAFGDNVRDKGYKYCFRCSGEAPQQVKENVMFLEELREQYGLDRVYIMHEDTAHSRDAGETIEATLREKGWEVLGKEFYPLGTTDFSSGLLTAQRLGAQILAWDYTTYDAAVLVNQWYALQIPALPVSCTNHATEEPGVWEETNGKVAYTIGNMINAGNVESEATEWTMEFYRAYEERWGLPPEGYGTSSSYMAIYILKDAIERAGTVDDADALVEALEETDLMGVYGRIRFDPERHQVIPSLDPEGGAVTAIYQWQDGARVCVFPPQVAVGEVMLPPYLMD